MTAALPPPLSVVIELPNALDPFQAARRLSNRKHLLLLESSMRQTESARAELGRYSFLMADPVAWFQPDATDLVSTFAWLDKTLNEYRVPSVDGLPPFQGGVAGLFGYEFNTAIERLPQTIPDDQAVALGVYDVVIAWDHLKERCWLISTGIPEADGPRRIERAQQRAERFRKLLDRQPPEFADVKPRSDSIQGHACPEYSHLTSNFDRESYIRTIEKALEYIHAGDIFQVNIAQQLLHEATADSLLLYEQLRACNPSTFGALFDLGQRQVISASPERLVSVRDGHIETRPIKGTRRRTSHPEIDIGVGQQLLASEKDRAENVMIVDLMRNDLSRICTDDSVRVTQFVELESYASVLHLVSAIQGTLLENVPMSELLRAVFPGGSITGAPKVRSMEIISELEPSPRGPYCGSLGYFGFNGTVDLNILIRTITAEHGVWKIPVGGGIVADSDPILEYEETWTKAHGMLKAVVEFAPTPAEEFAGGEG